MKRSDRRRGSAIVEFALASFLMVLIFGGVVQFGYSMYVYNSLISQVRSAARFAAVTPYTSTTATPTTEYSTAVKNVAVYGSPTATSGSTPLVRGLTLAKVEIAVTMNGTVAREITVRIINFSLDGIIGAITLNEKPSVTFVYNG
jgi:Flp pilus assembly protein TadG